MRTDKKMRHSRPLFGSGCRCSYGQFAKYLSGVGRDDRAAQTLGYVEAQIRLAHTGGAKEDV